MKIKFLVAEDVRMEANGKFTILGLFADDVIIMQAGIESESIPSGIPFGFEKITFLIHVSKLLGEHKFSGELFDPSGESYRPRMPLGEMNIKEGESHAILLEVKPFIVKKTGTYLFNFYVDEGKTPFTFEVIEKAKS